ncbi:hypothetical protein ACMU_09700 [Actibacterium mucosum KCTC 23349]|uniref:Uncharacterized protein n=1 Tax=Actibacterium mucosum KCTC 23349 TaxID=1454373 RepID=A0A037ZKF3_9RHOB|nr:hypothetical protein [Actibacterium mucosum]KAJ56027.1 hypothetical protein ACMU_09700 [Actibacterium mucosum KCTC 23349]
MSQMFTLSNNHGSITIDPALGQLFEVFLTDGERLIAPLNRAPWVDDPAIQADPSLLPIEKRLGGDFFCAPFGGSEIDGVPNHGHTANSPWDIEAREAAQVTMRSAFPILGATVRKRVQLGADAPLIYQEHWIEGGEGKLPVAHHPMTRLAGRGRLSCSPKRMIRGRKTPLDPGFNRLAVGVQTQDLTAFPAADGGTVDLTHQPIGTRHEDMVVMIEAEDSLLGWTAILREAEDDIVFVLKHPRILPSTMLWFSNGARDYAPWNGQHTGVIGIEDGRALGGEPGSNAAGPNPVNALGVPTVFDLSPGTTHRIPHVIGAIARPAGWDMVENIEIDGAHLILTGSNGAQYGLPFHAGFFEEDG